MVHTWENTKAGRLSRRSISYTLSHSRIPTKSTLQQISTVRSMSWQAELFLIVDPSLLQVLISLIIITSSQGSSSRGEWTSYFHFSIISRRTDTCPKWEVSRGDTVTWHHSSISRNFLRGKSDNLWHHYHVLRDHQTPGAGSLRLLNGDLDLTDWLTVCCKC